jgi:hypothetical protein
VNPILPLAALVIGAAGVLVQQRFFSVPLLVLCVALALISIGGYARTIPGEGQFRSPEREHRSRGRRS